MTYPPPTPSPHPIPTLHDLGADPRFNQWYPNQIQAILRAIDSPKRFVALCLPVGAGKSAIAMGRAVISGARSVYLTSSRGLQDRLGEDFGSMGLVDIRGQQNYQCVEAKSFGANDCMVSTAPCHSGIVCPSKESICTYYSAARTAKKSNLVVTNYPYWILQNIFGDGIGDFDLMVCDEAHAVVQELCNVLSTSIQKYEVEAILHSSFPTTHAGMEGWKMWASAHSMRLTQEIAAIKENIQALFAEGEYGQAHMAGKKLWERKDLKRRVDTILGAKGEWVAERKGESMTWDPIWPHGYSEQMLFHKIPKVVLMSATMNTRTMDLLGVPPEEYEFIEFDSTFPLNEGPSTIFLWRSSTRIPMRVITGHG